LAVKKIFKTKTRDTAADSFFMGLVKVFKKMPRIIDLNGQAHSFPRRMILIGNHSAASGPLTYRLALKFRFMTWSMHMMMEGYKSRWNYLYHVFYRQKLGYSKFKSFVIATLFALISRICYKIAGTIPVYYDNRLITTFRNSLKCLEDNVSVFVFPENSNSGYLTKIEQFFPGFLHLSKIFYKKYGVDLPIYTLYYSKTAKKIVIGKPMYYGELSKENSDKDIIENFRKYLNSLYDDYIALPAPPAI